MCGVEAQPIWEQFGNKTPVPYASNPSLAAVSVIEPARFWRKRVGVETAVIDMAPDTQTVNRNSCDPWKRTSLVGGRESRGGAPPSLTKNGPEKRSLSTVPAEIGPAARLPTLSLHCPSELRLRGGGGGIRTHETLSGLTVFKTAGVNHFPTPPF
jgi:hypothetical protein